MMKRRNMVFSYSLGGRSHQLFRRRNANPPRVCARSHPNFTARKKSRLRFWVRAASGGELLTALAMPAAVAAAALAFPLALRRSHLAAGELHLVPVAVKAPDVQRLRRHIHHAVD